MRDYAKIGPKFWIGATGKKLKAAGPATQVLALYLMSSPHANMLGIYYLPSIYMAHETGLGIEGASKALQSCIEAGFCAYDETTEMVWVFEMAKYQIAEELDPKDKRCVGVQNEYNALPSNPYLSWFFKRYASPFNMTKKRAHSVEIECPFEAPSEGLASQEQEQEQAQEQENSGELLLEAQAADASPPVVSIPLNDGSEYGVEAKQVEEWTLTYPAVDVVAELRKMRQWSIANPKKRKTRRGVLAFANTWLSNTQDKPKKTDQPSSMGSGEKYL